MPVYGTVYGDMHFIDPLGSIARVGYCIPVPDFYLVLHGLCCRKKHNNGLINQSINHLICNDYDKTEINYFIYAIRPFKLITDTVYRYIRVDLRHVSQSTHSLLLT